MNNLSKVTNDMVGQLCWNVRYSNLLNLLFELGEVHLHKTEIFGDGKTKGKKLRKRIVTAEGRWKLWIYLAYWRILDGNNSLATTSSSVSQICKAAAFISGQKLTSFTVKPGTGATRLEFDLGGVIEVRRYSAKSDDELWVLSVRRHRVEDYFLSVYGNGTYKYHPGSNPHPKRKEIREIAGDTGVN